MKQSENCCYKNVSKGSVNGILAGEKKMDLYKMKIGNHLAAGTKGKGIKEKLCPTKMQDS